MKTMTMAFAITVFVKKDTVGYYAFVPGLKGLHTDGDTPEEAANHAADAAQAYIESMIKHGEAIPIQQVIEYEKNAEDRLAYDMTIIKEIKI
jgi:predicted RNase H-like HicB family nuclease